MNWTLVGIIGISLFLVAWIGAHIKILVFDRRKIYRVPNSLDEFDERYPKDFDLIRKYSKKVTYSILAISIILTIGGIAWSVHTMNTQDDFRIWGDEEASIVTGEHLAARMGATIITALPLAGIWVANTVLLTKWKRKAGTSLEKHYSESG